MRVVYFMAQRGMSVRILLSITHSF
jgi:hypothetical protein